MRMFATDATCVSCFFCCLCARLLFTFDCSIWNTLQRHLVKKTAESLPKVVFFYYYYYLIFFTFQGVLVSSIPRGEGERENTLRIRSFHVFFFILLVLSLKENSFCSS